MNQTTPSKKEPSSLSMKLGEINQSNGPVSGYVTLYLRTPKSQEQARLAGIQNGNNYIHSCLTCDFITEYQYKMKKHVLGHHSKLKCCDACQLVFRNSNDYGEHVAKQHVFGFQCPDCYLLFETTARFKRHYKRHAPVKEHSCNIGLCEFRTHYKPSLKRHCAKVHKEKLDFTTAKLNDGFQSLKPIGNREIYNAYCQKRALFEALKGTQLVDKTMTFLDQSSSYEQVSNAQSEKTCNENGVLPLENCPQNPDLSSPSPTSVSVSSDSNFEGCFKTWVNNGLVNNSTNVISLTPSNQNAVSVPASDSSSNQNAVSVLVSDSSSNQNAVSVLVSDSSSNQNAVSVLVSDSSSNQNAVPVSVSDSSSNQNAVPVSVFGISSNHTAVSDTLSNHQAVSREPSSDHHPVFQLASFSHKQPFSKPIPPIKDPSINPSLRLDPNPKSESKVKLPKPESKVKNQKSESKVKLPKSESKVKLPKSESKVKLPKSESKVKLPKSESKVKNPKSESKVKTPTSAKDLPYAFFPCPFCPMITKQKNSIYRHCKKKHNIKYTGSKASYELSTVISTPTTSSKMPVQYATERLPTFTRTVIQNNKPEKTEDLFANKSSSYNDQLESQITLTAAQPVSSKPQTELVSLVPDDSTSFFNNNFARCVDYFTELPTFSSDRLTFSSDLMDFNYGDLSPPYLKSVELEDDCVAHAPKTIQPLPSFKELRNYLSRNVPSKVNDVKNSKLDLVLESNVGLQIKSNISNNYVPNNSDFSIKSNTKDNYSTKSLREFSSEPVQSQSDLIINNQPCFYTKDNLANEPPVQHNAEKTLCNYNSAANQFICRSATMTNCSELSVQNISEPNFFDNKLISSVPLFNFNANTSTLGPVQFSSDNFEEPVYYCMIPKWKKSNYDFDVYSHGKMPSLQIL